MELKLYKTVNKNLQAHGGFQYPEHGRVEAPDWNPAPGIECGRGLHAVELGAGTRFLEFENTWLECSQIEEPVKSSSRDKYRFKACVVRKLEHVEVIELCLQSLEWAYWCALKIDKGPSDDTRQAVYKSPEWAFRYARHVDRGPRNDTRQAASKSSEWAYWYALDIDREALEETREAACKSPEWAYLYAFKIDKKPRNDTRKAACASPEWAYYYARSVDEKPRDDTRAAAGRDPEYASSYKSFV